jgi:pyruvyltransferase
MLNVRQTTAWKIAKRLAVDPVRRVAVKTAYRGWVPLSWSRGKNWGDALSPVIVELLSGKPALHLAGLHHDRYLVIGSILGGANERAEVWGSGFIRQDESVIGRPRAVYAVRGPLSRALLLKQDIECPAVYGDPALLLPRFYNPKVPKRYSVGVIPHYMDKGCTWLERYRHDAQVLILDIESGVPDVVRAVKSCEVIISSSLHGLICADAYGVPNAWVQFSENVVGGDFKFRDYFLSIGAGEPTPVRISETTELALAVSKAEHRPLHIDFRKLILACPFLSEDLRREVLGAGPSTGNLPERFISTGSKSSHVRSCPELYTAS